MTVMKQKPDRKMKTIHHSQIKTAVALAAALFGPDWVSPDPDSPSYVALWARLGELSGLPAVKAGRRVSWEFVSEDLSEATGLGAGRPFIRVSIYDGFGGGGQKALDEVVFRFYGENDFVIEEARTSSW